MKAKSLIIIASMVLFALSCKSKPEGYESIKNADMTIDGQMVAELTSPPFVPKPIGNRPAKKLIVDMEIIEEEGELANGVKYVFWTFGGSVPGSFIRTRVGDEIEFTLKNHPDNKLPHNIDLHAVTGPGGGASSSFVAPGHEITFSFKVLNPGLFVYHCATAPVGMHIANGMYGLILVEPAGGLPPVDKEYYVMQGDFYTKGKHGETGLQPFDMQKAVDENADYVVFNGSVNGLIDENALTAKVGETVRLFVGNGGPNLVSSFHVIGEIFDRVHVEGGDLINKNIQTTLIPAGGAVIVDFKVDVPGTLILVDHSIFRAFNKGALGMLNVEGPKNKKIYSGVQLEGIYQPEGGTIQTMPEANKEAEKPVQRTLAERVKLGKAIYTTTCFACHQNNGEGLPNAFPPLAKSDFLKNDMSKVIDVILKGASGPMTVNGVKYDGVMPAQRLSDEDVANVLSYIYGSWGNGGKEVTPEMVSKRR
ncbi:MAG TPA: copper-containing nitrite reductase [Chitinophagales bacterium]|nr:copper-containing nitrite reductase [Chitinophagales bacterium]